MYILAYVIFWVYTAVKIAFISCCHSLCLSLVVIRFVYIEKCRHELNYVTNILSLLLSLRSYGGLSMCYVRVHSYTTLWHCHLYVRDGSKTMETTTTYNKTYIQKKMLCEAYYVQYNFKSILFHRETTIVDFIYI